MDIFTKYMNKNSDLWPQHIGSIWAALLSNHSLNPSSSIVEIGPGFTDKIGCGLAELRFQGTLYVVEPNKDALKWVVHRYHTLLPKATIIAVNEEIKDACSALPEGVEAILMNHVLDDMVLHASLNPDERQSIFSQIKPGESCLYQVKYTWQSLINDPQNLSELNSNIISELYSLVDHTQARIVGMSQYKSWFLHQHKLNEADLIGNKLLLEFVPHLGHMSSEDKDILQSYNQDPLDWLIIERENIIQISDRKQNIIQQNIKN